MVGSLLKLATPTIAPPPSARSSDLELDEPGTPGLALLASGLVPRPLPGCAPLPPKVPPLPSESGPGIYCGLCGGLPPKVPPLPSDSGPGMYCGDTTGMVGQGAPLPSEPGPLVKAAPPGVAPGEPSAAAGVPGALGLASAWMSP